MLVAALLTQDPHPWLWVWAPCAGPWSLLPTPSPASSRLAPGASRWSGQPQEVPAMGFWHSLWVPGGGDG